MASVCVLDSQERPGAEVLCELSTTSEVVEIVWAPTWVWISGPWLEHDGSATKATMTLSSSQFPCCSCTGIENSNNPTQAQTHAFHLIYSKIIQIMRGGE